MALQRMLADDSNISISTMISTSCAMLENLQEFNFNPALSEHGYIPGYTQQSDEVAHEAQTTACRDPHESNLLFESEATPFSHETYTGSVGYSSGKRYLCEFGSSVVTQSDYREDVTKPTICNAGSGSGSAADIGKRNGPVNSFIQQNSLTRSAEEVYLNDNQDADRIEDCHGPRFDMVHSDRNNSLPLKRDPTTNCKYSQWNVPIPTDKIDLAEGIRHELQPADWLVINQTTSTLEPNSSIGRSWGIHSGSVPLGPVFEEVSEAIRMGPSMITQHEKQTYDCNRFHCVQSQERDKEIRQCVNDTSVLKSGCSYFIPQPETMPRYILPSGVPTEYENREYQYFKDIAYPGNKIQSLANCEKMNLSVESPSTQFVRSDYLRSTSVSKMHVQNSEDDKTYLNGELWAHQTTDSTSCAITENRNDSNEKDVPNSEAEFESDEDSRGDRKPKQTSLGQEQHNRSIENIQRELELLEERRKKPVGPVNSVHQRLENYRFQAISKDTSSSLVDVDYMICSGVTVAGFKPRAIIRKRSKVNIPTDVKDQGYWQKRRKNNDSARKSRELKKEKEKNFYQRALELEYENIYLHECLSLAEAELAAVGRRISAPPMNRMGLF